MSLEVPLHGGKGAAPAQWSYPLFSCGESTGTCLYAWCCTTCAAASTRKEYDQSNFLFNCCCVPPPMLRNIIREGPYNIEGTCLQDILITMCCTPCVITQMLSEVRKRGPGKMDSRGPGSNEWSNPLFSCCADPKLFLMSWCCHPCQVASTRQEYDSSNWVFNCLCMSGGLLRNIIREGYAIKGNCMSDILLSWLCAPCSLSQLAREVKARGAVDKAPQQHKMT